VDLCFWSLGAAAPSRSGTPLCCDVLKSGVNLNKLMWIEKERLLRAYLDSFQPFLIDLNEEIQSNFD
jgi:hypothetical protein